MRRLSHFALALSFSFALFVTSARGADLTVTVSAGQFDRKDTVVQFTLPANAVGGSFELRDDGGAVTPVQIDANRRAAFILNDLKAGQSKMYHLQPTRAALATERPAVVAAKEGGAVRLQVEGKDVLSYQGEKTPLPAGFEAKFQRGGYIFPVLTPSGKLVTDDYPPNHKHHHGIWSPWTKTEFEGRHPDFWNMGDQTGTVEFVGLDGTWSGPVMAGLRARHRMVDLSAKPEPKAALNETWEVAVYRAGADAPKPYYVFDLAIEQTCASDSPLVLPKYHYGGLGFRGNRNWDGKDNAQFLTSEGKDRSNGNETTGRWCHVGGLVDGQPAGVAILDHPSNFRHPQPMRLHPTEPFFCYAPSQGGDWRIEPGKPYRARYRFVVSDGPPDVKEIDRLWNDFAHPPEVKVE